MITLVRKIKVMNLDIQMVTLNAASGAALVAEAVKMNSAHWSVGFLIISIAILNISKGIATIIRANKGTNETEKKE